MQRARLAGMECFEGLLSIYLDARQGRILSLVPPPGDPFGMEPPEIDR